MATLVEAQIAAQSRVRLQTAAFVERAWQSLGSWNEPDVDRFLAVILPVLLAAQRATVSLVDAYLARALERAPLGINPNDIALHVRGATAPSTVYRRPFVTTWTALKEGRDFEDAVNAGRARASSAAETDVQLAMRDAVAEITRIDPRIVGYRRVPNPTACDFCLLASTQRYHSGELLPLHNHCACGVSPIVASKDPGQVIDKDLLKRLKDKTATVAVRQHGELGPVLVNAEDHFDRLRAA